MPSKCYGTTSDASKYKACSSIGKSHCFHSLWIFIARLRSWLLSWMEVSIMKLNIKQKIKTAMPHWQV